MRQIFQNYLEIDVMWTSGEAKYCPTELLFLVLHEYITLYEGMDFVDLIKISS